MHPLNPAVRPSPSAPGRSRFPGSRSFPALSSRDHRVVGVMIAVLLLALPAEADDLITNGSFEDGLHGWSAFWSRDRETGQAQIDTNTAHRGRASLQVEHRGDKDWCVNAADRLRVTPGDLYELEGWTRVTGEGEGDSGLSVILYDRAGNVLDWSFGGSLAARSPDWQSVHSRFVIPPGAGALQPRWLGNGPVNAWLDDVSLRRAGSLDELRRAAVPAELTLSNQWLSVSVNTRDVTLAVRDRRTGRQWNQQRQGQDLVARDARITGKSSALEMTLLHVPTSQDLAVTVQLEPAQPELTVTLSATGRLSRPLRFPHPFVTEPGTHLVVPMNEGISYPVEDASLNPMRLIAYGGHGICMAFWGVTDGHHGQMAIIETPDDAAIQINRFDGNWCIAPEWDAQKGSFGYPRKLRYVFFAEGGHVAMAKRYRAHAQQMGRLKTLAQKRAANPNVDLLVGAVNVWCWDREAVAIVKELQAAGIQRILWSNRRPPEDLRRLNELGVLTSRYDIYQDAMNPTNVPNLRGAHPDWTSDAWPHHIMIGANGDWTRGWRVKGKDDNWYPCGVLCDRLAPEYAARRIPEELRTHPYRARFIDTTTASPWRECHATNHPMTRSESRIWKMKLLEYVSRDAHLVTGCETGHDAAVPFLHYFEGMLSLGPYRVPDAGRDMRRIWDEVPERVAKFQLGHRYRLPLWELVYHDCVVAQWYWGDYNNKLPALWDKRDLFNALYGTPPMFMFDRKLWRQHQNRFVQSYQTTGPIARATGYAEMTDHRFLTPDRSVQQTAFANGVTVTVNFGEQPYALSNGKAVPPGGLAVQGVDR